MRQFIVSMLAVIRVFCQSRSDTALEVLALRQQVAVLNDSDPKQISKLLHAPVLPAAGPFSMPSVLRRSDSGRIVHSEKGTDAGFCSAALYESPVYLANHDARAALTLSDDTS